MPPIPPTAGPLRQIILPTRGELTRAFPQAPNTVLDLWSRLMPALHEHCAIDRQRWVHLAGQIGHETNGLQIAALRAI